MKVFLFILTFAALIDGSLSGSPESEEIYDIEFIRIPSGSFQMGSEKGYGDEKPVHEVILDEFWISATEITQAQYFEVMGKNPSEFKGDNLPVEQVNWYDAVIFCNRLSEAAGIETCYNLRTWKCDNTRNGFRLPTEAEWEYSARGGLQYEYGTNDGRLNKFNANYNLELGQTNNVGSYENNPFGLFDMAGNVWEWCGDWYEYNYYKNSPKDNPQGPKSGSSRIVRGGSWSNKWHECRGALRGNQSPKLRSNNIGFRVVRRP